MKRTSLVIFTFTSLFIPMIVQSQIDLTYTAEYNGSFIELDSILIENLTQGCDTTLYYPDSVLSIITVGIMERENNTDTSLIINQSYPNPFSETTIIDMYLPEEDDVNIQVLDWLGRKVTAYNGLLIKGWHSFQVKSGESAIYFFRVETSKADRTIKLVHIGEQKGQLCTLQYMGINQSNKQYPVSQNKSIQSGFICFINDHLRYIGYATHDTLAGNDIIEDTLIGSDSFIFEITNGLPCAGTTTVTDIDSNTYNTVQIGIQCWMAENLKATKYPNGTSIPNITHDTVWANLGNNNTDDAYCYYENNPYSEYGALYTWSAAMGDNAVSSNSNPSGVQGVCPTGWHLPSDAEWTQLIDYLGGTEVAGGKMKEEGINHWNSPNTGADNSSGYTALPGGHRNVGGLFFYQGRVGNWWSATEGSGTRAMYQDLGYDYSVVFHFNDYKSNGCSIRCVKDD